LQQTAEYIDRLELEKQQLAGQNQHLQRLVDSLGGGNNNNNECPQQIIQQTITSPSTGGTAIKKRKLDQVMTVQTISDSSDEGLGSMSPEPVSQMIFSNGASAITKTHMVSATSVSTINVKDYVNLQNQMETERRHRIQLEEQLKQLEMQFYSNHQAPAQKYHQIQSHEESDEVDGQQQQQQQVETIVEEKIILRQAGHEDIHYIGTVPHHQQFVVVSTSSPGSSPKHVIINDDDDNSRTLSSDELHKDDLKMVRQKMSPKHHHHHHHHREIRIPSILEQAIKAEPKVEVERINSPCIQINMVEETAVQSPPRPNSPSHIRTTYPNNHTRPNLEAIVEAIRHLEGDAFDMDDAQETKQSPNSAAQEVPLALTTGNKYQNCGKDNQQPFLKFRQTSTSQSGLPTFSLSVPSSQQQQQYQQRPGVIVVKQSS
jgi:transcription factor AP-4